MAKFFENFLYIIQRKCRDSLNLNLVTHGNNYIIIIIKYNTHLP